MRSSPQSPECVDLSPIDFAILLDLGAEDAPYLATAAVRLPAVWVAEWRTRMGVRELTTNDLSIILGVTPGTILRYLRSDACPRLSCRVGAGRGARARLVSPANLVAFLRARSQSHYIMPKVRETAGQRENRALAAAAELAELCGDLEDAAKIRAQLAAMKPKKK
jgi:hypothetical protein